MFVGSANSCAIRNEVLEIWERLYDDESSKDIELQCQDGSVRAHSLILAQISEPLKCSLASGMQETQTKCIRMTDFTIAHIRFFLRFAYTGHANSSDWATETDAKKKETETKEHHCIEEETARDLFGSDEEARDLFGSDDEERDEHKKVPVDLLLTSAAFAKQYDVPGFFSLMIDLLKRRLSHKNFDSIMAYAVKTDMTPVKLCCLNFAQSCGNFNPSNKIKKMFDNKQLSPEVHHELLAIWPEPPAKKSRMSIA